MSLESAADKPSTMRRDIVSAYLATSAKVGSWVIVLALVYRRANIAEFAMLSLIRGTLGILNYATFGLAPAMIHLLAKARTSFTKQNSRSDSVLAYQAPMSAEQRTLVSLHATGLVIALACGALGLIITFAYAFIFNHIYEMPDRLVAQMPAVVIGLGIGTIFRLMGDAQGSLLQASGEIARDNLYIVIGEAFWICLTLTYVYSNLESPSLIIVSYSYAFSGMLVFLARSFRAQKISGLRFPRWTLVDPDLLRKLLSFGFLVWFAQLADFLYSPCDYVLIGRLLTWKDVAAYTPAMQVDMGLLLLVGGLANVLLPHSASAHAAGDSRTVRRYYLRGTLSSAAILLVASILVVLAAPMLLKLWLGEVIPGTLAILPWVLMSTVVGGSSAVGRSILIGTGRVKAFSIAAIIAGVANVILSYIFVRYLHLGLRGIIYGTIVAVVGRCAIWMPWYVMKTLREAPAIEAEIVEEMPVAPPPV